MNSLRRLRTGWFAITGLAFSHLLLSLPSGAQVVNDGATNTLNHVTNTITGGATVGTNGSFTLLILTNSALLTNSGNGTIGLNGSANSNSVRLTSTDTRWLVGLDLTVGSSGSVNHLVTSNGARVENNFGALGISPTSTNNDALVTGAGSLWSNRNDFYVGYVGHGNSLVVSNGGAVADNSGVLGADPLSSNNLAIISGASSIWSNRASLFVGFSGNGNRLVASNNATIFASNNISVGHNSGSISNQLLISGGALLTNNGNAVLGFGSGASSNSVFLSGTNTAWFVGADFLVGSNGAFNRLVISNGALLVNRQGVLNSSLTSSNNQALVTGPGSVWSNSLTLSLGTSFDNNGGRSQVVVSNGARLISRSGVIGAGDTGGSNSVVLTGTNSVWTNELSLSVGNLTDGNSLTIGNAAHVFCSDGFLGHFVGSQNNSAVVTGGDSLWQITSALQIGTASSGNGLFLTKNGTIAVGDHLFLGSSFPAASTNRFIVSNSSTLLVTNATQTALVALRGGTNTFDGGTMEMDQLLITNALGFMEFNGGLLITRGAFISNGAPFVVGVSGFTPAIWDVRAGPLSHFVAGDIQIGDGSSLNQLIITNGASFTNSGNGILGANSGADSNSVLVSGSRWVLGTDLHLGQGGALNHLIVSNGAFLQNEIGVIGQMITSTNNEVVVSGPGSFWNNLVLILGAQGSSNRLLITNQGTVFANVATIGSTATSLGNRLVVDGGSLIVTNSVGTGYLNVQRGTNVLNSGLIQVDRLLVTNMPSIFEFSGGTLSTKSTTNSIGRAFTVGNGLSAATLNLAGNGAHNFFATGLTISSNASLVGNGTILGPVRVESGGTLAPGASIGKLSLINSIILQGSTVMEISKTGSVLTNDQLQVIGPVTFGGTLTVTNIGSTALGPGDQFQLFSAGGYVGSFTTITLPPLALGLTWTNKLSVDGSIQVVGSTLKFAAISRSGTNLLISGAGGSAGATYWVLTTTNLSVGVSNWTRLLTNQFDASGNFVFTNSICATAPQRFFRLQVP